MSFAAWPVEHLHALLVAYDHRSASFGGLPPSANHAWLPNKRGGKIIAPEYRAFIASKRLELRQSFWGFRPRGPLALVIELHSPRFVTKKGEISKAMDLDNRIKTVLDMLHGGRKSPGIIPCDDSLYWNISSHKIPSEAMERTVLHVIDMGSRRS